jgi:hypothetical protein
MAGAHIRDLTRLRGKLSVHSPFQEGSIGNPLGPRPKSLPALRGGALNEPVAVIIDGKRREITKREARLSLSWSTNRPAPICATKMLIDC